MAAGETAELKLRAVMPSEQVPPTELPTQNVFSHFSAIQYHMPVTWSLQFLQVSNLRKHCQTLCECLGIARGRYMRKEEAARDKLILPKGSSFCSVSPHPFCGVARIFDTQRLPPRIYLGWHRRSRSWRRGRAGRRRASRGGSLTSRAAAVIRRVHKRVAWCAATVRGMISRWGIDSEVQCP